MDLYDLVLLTRNWSVKLKKIALFFSCNLKCLQDFKRISWRSKEKLGQLEFSLWFQSRRSCYKICCMEFVFEEQWLFVKLQIFSTWLELVRVSAKSSNIKAPKTKIFLALLKKNLKNCVCSLMEFFGIT